MQELHSGIGKKSKMRSKKRNIEGIGARNSCGHDRYLSMSTKRKERRGRREEKDRIKGSFIARAQ